MYLSAPYLLLIRAHSAYRLAASCAFSGQAAELHPLLRLMLARISQTRKCIGAENLE